MAKFFPVKGAEWIHLVALDIARRPVVHEHIPKMTFSAWSSGTGVPSGLISVPPPTTKAHLELKVHPPRRAELDIRDPGWVRKDALRTHKVGTRYDQRG